MHPHDCVLRIQAQHSLHERHWGVGMQASWDPGLKRRGVRLSLLSARGQDAGGQTTLWNNTSALMHPMGIGQGTLGTPTRTDSEVAYGLAAFGGLLTPYSRLQLFGPGRALSLGTTWSAPSGGARLSLPLLFGVEVTRQAYMIGGTPETGVVVHMTAPF